MALGESVGPITSSTRDLYIKKYNRLISSTVENTKQSSSKSIPASKPKRSRSGSRSTTKDQPKTPQRKTRLSNGFIPDKSISNPSPQLSKSTTISSSYVEEPSTASVNLQTSLNSTLNRSYDFNASGHRSFAGGRGEFSDVENDEKTLDFTLPSAKYSAEGLSRRREKVFNTSYGKGMTSFGRPLRSRFYDSQFDQTGVMNVDGFKVKDKPSFWLRASDYVSTILLISVVIFLAVIAFSYLWIQRDEELLQRGELNR